MFAWQCFTYILCACWENESALDGCFVTLQQFVTLETSSLTSCIFPVGISFRNSLGLNIVVGYAIWVVCSYAYMAKCTVMRFVVMDLRMSNKPIFLEGVFCYFLLFEFTRWKFFFGWWGTSPSSGTLFLWGRGSCWWRRWNNGDYWCSFWSRWSNTHCWYCCWRRFFAFKHLCNVLGVLSSSL